MKLMLMANAKLRQLATDATPGPWLVHEDLIEFDENDDLLDEPERMGWLIEQGPLRMWIRDDGNESDVEFVSAATPQRIVGLVDRIEQLETLIADLECVHRAKWDNGPCPDLDPGNESGDWCATCRLQAAAR